MNGFDFVFIGILAMIGGALLITQGRWRSSYASLQRGRDMALDGSFRLRQQAVRHAHNRAGAWWLAVSVAAFVLGATRGRDTMFLVEHPESLLIPLMMLTVALVVTSARADRAGRKAVGSDEAPQPRMGTTGTEVDAAVSGRIEALKRTFTITRARSVSAPPSPGQPPATLSHITQCPEDSFWKDLPTPRNRPEA